MKYIAFTILGVVLLAAICTVVLWSCMPRAKVSIQSVTPLTTNVSSGPDHPTPIWEVAITNVGRVRASWTATLLFKNNNHEWTAPGPGAFGMPHGALAAGQSDVVHIGVPDSRTNWAVTITYWPIKGPVEKTLDEWLKPVPMLRSMLPNSSEHYAAANLYPGTNVGSAR
jgi:hypothetical protein